MTTPLAIIGAGLAGSEAAWQLAQHLIPVHLYEMRPVQQTPAHKTDGCAELVCSNSFKSLNVENAHGLLKAEMKHFGSLILNAAEQFSVPAGQALAVDREPFSQWITEQLENHPLIELKREEVADIQTLTQQYDQVLIATGPLTSSKLSDSLKSLLGEDYLSFYDAIAPVLMADSIDDSIAYKASRYDKGEADYWNCPMSREQYDAFIQAILDADKVEQHSFENIRPFEGCLPIEVMAERGAQTLRYGPMKPVGLVNPHTGELPNAVVQLRQENQMGTLYNMVGFQTKMTWTAQKEVFKMIPGLENAEFVRLGSIHRNTFINSPQLLTPHLNLKEHPNIYFAGQITGVEGYIESTSMGILAAQQMASKFYDQMPVLPDPQTMMGGLIRYITETNPKHFQPMNANFGLLEPPHQKMSKAQRKTFYAERALQQMESFRKHFHFA